MTRKDVVSAMFDGRVKKGHRFLFFKTYTLVNLVNIQFNSFIKQKYRSATYTDMHEIHVEKL